MEKQLKAIYRLYPDDIMEMITPSGKIVRAYWSDDKSHCIIEIPAGLEQ